MFKAYQNYIQDNPKGYWFKRKLYGWGWTPARWQGWATLIVFIVLLVLNAIRLNMFAMPSDSAVITFVLETFLLVGVLISICYFKGESPKWQWGVPQK